MKKNFLLILSGLFLIFLISLTDAAGQADHRDHKPRVIVMTDGEGDDRSSMVRFLYYANDVELLAIIQTNSQFQRNGWSSDFWIEEQIDAYEKIYPNLIVHDPSYPTPYYLRSIIWVGDEEEAHLPPGRMARPAPGDEPKIDPADWPDTPGSDRIVEILLEDDPRDVYIQAWGGGNTAARAFHKLKTEYPDDYERAVSKAVMYNIWYQDSAGNYIERYHPGVTMVLSHYFWGTWAYESQIYTHQFIRDYVQNDHGPLGKLYPQNYISEGDTPAFLYSLANGLRGHEDPTYGGWGGRFYRVDGLDNVYWDVSRGSYRKWIDAANRDWHARLIWGITENFEDANHRPVIRINGDLDRTVRSGETVVLEAEVHHPNGLSTSTNWWHYKEAGTYCNFIGVGNSGGGRVSFIAPEVTSPQTIHMICEVIDQGTPHLTSYKRVIITLVP